MTARRASRPEPAAGAKLPPYRLAPVAELVPYARNSNVHSPAQVSRLAAMITEFGWTNPVLIDGKRGIIAGHGRVMAAQQLGMAMVPTIELRHLTAAQKRAYVIADNQSARLSSTDRDILASELLDLQMDGFDLSLTGFDALELDGLLGPAAGQTDPDDAPPVQAEAVSRLGDVWTLGRHRLVCGDATSEVDVSLALAGVKPQMVLTDPPYGMSLDTDFSGAPGARGSLGRKSGSRGNVYQHVIGDHDDFSPALIEAVFTACPDARECFLFGADYYAELLPGKNDGSWLVWDKRKESQAEAIGSEFELIWSRRPHKRRMLRHDWFGFLSSSNPVEARNRVHPTQKPSTLIADIMQQWGAPGDAVYDPFLGSGTTLIAAEQTGRTCIACEIEPRYADVCCRRFAAFTDTEPTLADDGRPFSAIAAERTRRAA